MVFQTFIPNAFATKKNNRGHLDLLLHGIFNLKKCHWFINNDLFGNDNCHRGDNKKMPKNDTLDALEEHEEHDDDYQTNSNW